MTPTSWRPLLSMPRFLLADFPVFLALASLVEARPRARELVLAAFAAAGALLAVASGLTAAILIRTPART